MNEMLIGLLLFQGVLLGFVAGWIMGNKPVKRLKEEIHEYDIMMDKLEAQNQEYKVLTSNLEEKCKVLVEATPKVNAVNPLDNVLSALIAETDKQDEAEALRLKEIKSAWNYQPVGLSKRMKGDS